MHRHAAPPRPRGQCPLVGEEVLTPLNRVGDTEACRRGDDGRVATPGVLWDERPSWRSLLDARKVQMQNAGPIPLPDQVARYKIGAQQVTVYHLTAAIRVLLI
jgi:hypothetical protein